MRTKVTATLEPRAVDWHQLASAFTGFTRHVAVVFLAFDHQYHR